MDYRQQLEQNEAGVRQSRRAAHAVCRENGHKMSMFQSILWYGKRAYRSTCSKCRCYVMVNDYPIWSRRREVTGNALTRTCDSMFVKE